jgi:hypothetical protein
MSFNSKRIIISISAGMAAVIAYIVYISGGRAPVTEDIAAWARLMLVFIGIGVALQIAIEVISRIALAGAIAVKEKRSGKTDAQIGRMVDMELKEDERDFMIHLKALRIGYACAGIGLLAALAALALGAGVIVALHITVGAGALASLIEGGVKVFIYERGVRNG